jgi:prepilin-type N-terminal cleavage/methylation domain-containing protein
MNGWKLGGNAADGEFRMYRQRGFSLIELLIVVAIILIVSAIAVPNIFRAKINANESSAVSSLRTIVTAEITYSSTYPTVGFSTNLATLGGTNCTASPSSATACILDNTLAQATTPSNSRSGYYFTYTPDSALGYTLYGDPAYWNRSGTKHYYTDGGGVIHYNAANQTSSVTDPTIQ